MTTNADRHLLFGLLALQNGIINQGQLVAGFQVWTLDKSRSLADHLEARGDLNKAGRALLEGLAEFHLEAHGGDLEKSLAGVSTDKSTRENLARIGDRDIEATLAYVDPADASMEEDADRTGTYSVGSVTSDGQRFRVLRPHARGGLGEVFVALDTELNREVALKRILDRHADDPDSRQRFLIEAEITGGLEHPGIVPVYGLGAYDGGRPYYAMRLIKGDSLKEAIARFHQLPRKAFDPSTHSVELRKLLRRFTDVCNAIEYAHSRRVLHRDIKPGNIILGKHGETLVVDWGLAKPQGKGELSAESGERALMPFLSRGTAETLPGSALGTPGYMSPEQARGDLDRLEPRSDVYSLGATLYCLLTGRAPFDGEVGVVLDAVRKSDFPPPRRLDPSIHPALEAVCLKAMALEPSERYASARALADDVDRWLADEPVSARPEGFGGRLARWSRRYRAWVRAGAAALVLVTFVSVFAWAQLRAAQEGNLKLTTSLGLARGQSLCEQGLTGDGLLWLTRALRLCPDSDAERKRDIRNHIGYWMGEVHSLRAQTFGPGKFIALGIAADGKTAVSCNGDAPALLWDPATGRSIGSPLPSQGGVLSVVFAPDGGRVITGGGDGTARLWDTRTGAEIGPAQRLGASVTSLAFSPDGRFVVAGLNTNKARLWDVSTGHQVGSDLLLEPNTAWDGFMGTVAFSRDGRKILTASRDGSFRLWNAADGSPAGAAGRHPAFALSASLSSDGRRVLTVGPSGGQVWDLEAGKPDGPMLTHHEASLFGAFHPEQPWAAVGFDNGSTLIWDFTDRPAKLIARIEQRGSIRAVAFTPDGRALVTASDDGTARLWEVPSGRPLGGPLYHPSKHSVTHLAISGDGRGIITGCDDGGSRSWKVGPSRSFDPALPNRDEVWITTFSPDGRLVLTGGGEQPLRVWETRTGRPVGKPMEQPYVKCAAFSPDGRFAVVGSYPGVARLWDVQTGALILERPSEPGIFAAAAHGPTGFILLYHRSDGEVIVMDPKGEAVYRGLPAEKRDVRVAALSGDGSTAAVGGSTGEVRVWNVLTGQRMTGGPGLGFQVEALSLSDDGRVVMAGYKDGSARVWDIRNGTLIGRVLNHSGRIRAVALSPGGRLAATGGCDRTIRLWETATGLPNGPGFPTAGAVIAVAFSPDGRLILAGDGDNAAKFWDIAPAAAEGEERLALRASLMANLEFDNSGNLGPLTPKRWDHLRLALPDQIVRDDEPTPGKKKRDDSAGNSAARGVEHGGTDKARKEMLGRSDLPAAVFARP